MTSTHCTDCPYHDSNNPSYCCSNAITPKPIDDHELEQRYEDEEFSRLMQMRGYGYLVGVGDV